MGYMEKYGFGDRLRKGRESAGLTVTEVSTALRIRPDIIRALEEEDFSSLPAKAFARNQISAYARFLGEDTVEMTGVFISAFNDYEKGGRPRYTQGSSPINKESRVSTRNGDPLIFEHDEHDERDGQNYHDERAYRDDHDDHGYFRQNGYGHQTNSRSYERDNRYNHYDRDDLTQNDSISHLLLNRGKYHSKYDDQIEEEKLDSNSRYAANSRHTEDFDDFEENAFANQNYRDYLSQENYQDYRDRQSRQDHQSYQDRQSNNDYKAYQARQSNYDYQNRQNSQGNYGYQDRQGNYDRQNRLDYQDYQGGQDRDYPGQMHAGQTRVGQTRVGQMHAGQTRLGQMRADQTPVDQTPEITDRKARETNKKPKPGKRTKYSQNDVIFSKKKFPASKILFIILVIAALVVVGFIAKQAISNNSDTSSKTISVSGGDDSSDVLDDTSDDALTEMPDEVDVKATDFGLKLTVKDGSRSWIQVDVDGSTPLAETVQGPEELKYTVEKEASIQVGNTGGVTVTVDGQEVELESDGGVGVLTLTLKDGKVIKSTD